MARGIQSYHPFIVFIYYILAIGGLMLYQHPLFLLPALVLIIIFHLLLDLGEQLKKWGWMIAIMSLFIITLTPVFNRRGNHILFYLFDNPVMLEAIIQGFMIALTLISIITAFITFNIVITADKFLFLFSRILPQWGLLTMLSMRFVPMLRRRIKEMEDIQQLKGVSVKQGSVHSRARNGMLMLQMLLTGSLEESIQSADSMTARGYGLQKRSTYQAFNMKRKDWWALCYLVGLGVLVYFGWWLGDGVLQLLPVLEKTGLEGREYMYLLIWLLFIGFPVWVEGREVIKWKYYQQEM